MPPVGHFMRYTKLQFLLPIDKEFREWNDEDPERQERLFEFLYNPTEHDKPKIQPGQFLDAIEGDR